MKLLHRIAGFRVADRNRSPACPAAGSRHERDVEPYSPRRGGGIGTSAIAQIAALAVAGRPDVRMHRTPECVGPVGVAHDLERRPGTEAGRTSRSLIGGDRRCAEHSDRRPRIVGGERHVIEHRLPASSERRRSPRASGGSTGRPCAASHWTACRTRQQAFVHGSNRCQIPGDRTAHTDVRPARRRPAPGGYVRVPFKRRQRPRSAAPGSATR